MKKTLGTIHLTLGFLDLRGVWGRRYPQGISLLLQPARISWNRLPHGLCESVENGGIIRRGQTPRHLTQTEIDRKDVLILNINRETGC
jgi:hypothetical protein